MTVIIMALDKVVTKMSFLRPNLESTWTKDLMMMKKENLKLNMLKKILKK